ncbi:MAG: alcohol dehydrogenase catalytic domain-containing protein [Spirochaetes bacterium]|nr:alcohol dehydrogenase catalytic domain-containing protein [Spirochaetota bacterium]
MKAALLVEPGRIEVREVPDPVAGPGGLVLEVEWAGTTGTDLKAFRRGHPKIPMPGRFGHEVVGRVGALGEGASGWTPGERVIALHSSPCGRCPPCRRGQTNLCDDFEKRLNLGAFASRLAVPADIARVYTFRVPAHVPPRRALFLQSLSCVVHSLSRLRLEKGERVLVQGIGCLGLLHALVARLQGAQVLLAARRPERRALAEKLGFEAVEVDDGGLARLPGRFGARGGSEAPDAVIDAAGTLPSWQAAVATVRPGGRVLFFGGLPASVSVPLDHPRVHYQEIDLINTFHYTPKDVSAATKILFEGNLEPERWLSDTDLGQLAGAFAELEAGRALKYAVSPGT